MTPYLFFRWAPVPGSCPPGTRFTGTHCEAMPRCQAPPPRGAAEGRRWCGTPPFCFYSNSINRFIYQISCLNILRCETPPFSFCSNWRHEERQERKAGCCLPSGSDVNVMGSEKEHTGQIEDGQTAAGKPNTDEHMDTWKCRENTQQLQTSQV